METDGMELEIIINPKTTDDGQAVIQVQIYKFYAQVSCTLIPSISSARNCCRSSHQTLQERARN
jgi:hypothetical protein